MRWRNTANGHGSLAVSIHWLAVLLIVAAYATMDLRSLSPKGSALRAAMATWHYALGLSVFALVWLRLLARATGPAPRTVPPPAAWQARLASAAHVALFALMIGAPLLGWLTVSAKGEQVSFLGAALPALAGKDEALARSAKDLHEALATVGYFLVGLHAAAALFHHYARRDNTLTMMWYRT